MHASPGVLELWVDHDLAILIDVTTFTCHNNHEEGLIGKGWSWGGCWSWGGFGFTFYVG